MALGDTGSHSRMQSATLPPLDPRCQFQDTVEVSLELWQTLLGTGLLYALSERLSLTCSNSCVYNQTADAGFCWLGAAAIIVAVLSSEAFGVGIDGDVEPFDWTSRGQIVCPDASYLCVLLSLPLYDLPWLVVF